MTEILTENTGVSTLIPGGYKSRSQGGITVGTKRLNIELPFEQYEFLQKEAAERGLTISALLRHLIQARQPRPSKDNRGGCTDDSFSLRRGSFDGPPNLAEEHDRTLYADGPR
jgi:hypothetical protein